MLRGHVCLSVVRGCVLPAAACSRRCSELVCKASPAGRQCAVLGECGCLAEQPGVSGGAQSLLVGPVNHLQLREGE